MAVVISLNEASARFAGLDMKHVALIIGAVSEAPMFYNFVRSGGPVGSAGTNNKILAVSKSYPLSFENADFGIMINDDPLSSSRTVSQLIDFMRKELVIVTKDGVAQTPEEVLVFTP